MTSGRITEAELEDLKSRNPCDIVAGGWVSLRRHGQKMVGPCPICSADPKSRDATRFECWADGWVCAVCADGGDVIRLVERVNGCSFMDAIAFLGGKRELVPGEAMLAEAHRAKLRAYRERERRKLWAMWHPAVPIAGTVAESYLALRHLTAPVTSTARLRYLANCPMYVTGAASTKPVHTGPAMLAAIVGADGRFSGLHITWLDLARPKGKAEVPDPTTGDLLPAKKVRGSKSGGRIEIVPRAAPRRLIIGEGIETVLAVWTALDGAGQDLTDTAFWSAVDLGNLGGRAAATVPHPTLKTANNHTRRVPGPVPDLTSPGLAIPDSVEDIVLLGDGDSDRFLTECALARAAARFAREGRTVCIAWAPAGSDFNDVLQRPDGAAKILAALAAAAPPGPISIVAPAPPASPGRRKKVQASQTGGGGDDPPDEGTGGDGKDLNEQLAFYPQTDLGNAERFRERNVGKILWCPALGWLAWDGKRWSREAAEEAVKIAEHITVRAVQKEAKAIKGTKLDKVVAYERNGDPIYLSDKLKKWGRASEAAN